MNPLAWKTDLPRNYRYSLTTKLFAGAWRMSYDVIGAAGAVSLNVSGPHHYGGEDHYSAGLECHWRSPPAYMCDRPPSHDECHVLKCPCWHDGTSLYAQERFLPLVLRGEHEVVFALLAAEADDRLVEKSEAA